MKNRRSHLAVIQMAPGPPIPVCTGLCGEIVKWCGRKWRIWGYDGRRRELFVERVTS